jgi:hypothetical protein
MLGSVSRAWGGRKSEPPADAKNAGFELERRVDVATDRR